MYIDKDKKNLTSEQKLGKYNILLSILKIIGMVIFILIHFSSINLILKYDYFTYGCIAITLFAILHLILFCKIKEYKIVCIVLIILFPVIGALIYLLAGNNSLSKKQKNKLNKIEERNSDILNRDNTIILDEFKEITKLSRYNMYINQGIQFFSTGEEFFNDLLYELKNAKKSILIDIYILSKGELLNEIIKILDCKVKEGVIVEIIYDSLGSIFKVPKTLKNEIKNAGIKLYKYKKFNFNISDYINHREHKKIFLIDGKIAYTGGINIADEYINKKELHRVWKDGGIKLYGNVVISYMLMYLKIKEQITNKTEDIKKYLLEENIYKNKDGVVFSYSDGPDNDNKIVKNTYIYLINSSKKYLYIVTPYFIPSKDIVKAIKQASGRGVDVKILLPHIADKNIVQYANRSYYKELLNCGAKVYEYKKGFIHTKYMVSDNTSLVGTANLDYKSLYFNFECMNLSHKTGIEEKIKKEFELDIKDAICINMDDIKNQSIIEKSRQIIARFLTPLL